MWAEISLENNYYLVQHVTKVQKWLKIIEETIKDMLQKIVHKLNQIHIIYKSSAAKRICANLIFILLKLIFRLEFYIF